MTLPISLTDLLLKSDRETVDKNFFNKRWSAIYGALTSIDARMVIYDAQVANLVQLGLDRLNSSLGPFLTQINEAAGLGFLVCKAAGLARSLTAGNAVAWTITQGASIFTPTTYLLAQDDNDSTNWGILSVDAGGWVQATASLATHVVYASKTQSSTLWTISCNSAIIPAFTNALAQAIAARDAAIAADVDATAQAAGVAAAVAAIQAGPVSSVAGKTGAVTLVEGDIANLTADLAAKATITAMNSGLAGKQTSSPKLDAIVALTWATDQLLLTTGAGSIATQAVSAFIKTLLDDADASTALSTLGVSAFAKTLLDDADASAARATLGVVGASVATITDAASTTFSAQSGATIVARLSANGNRTLTAPTGTPTDGQKVVIEHTAAGGSARTLTLTTGVAGGFRFGSDILAPLSATVAGKIDRIGVIYNQPANRWDVVGYVKGF